MQKLSTECVQSIGGGALVIDHIFNEGTLIIGVEGDVIVTLPDGSVVIIK